MLDFIINIGWALGAIVAIIAVLVAAFWLWDQGIVKVILFFAACLAAVGLVLWEIAMFGGWVRGLF
jgi:hypothetical protein